jgi:cytoskeletal protein RodZ
MLRGFTQKKVHSYTLGEQLKNIRSTGRITLSEVSRETKIPVKYLEMIEEGKYESLPPDVYVKGFLRGYAEFLGADPKKMINLYQREKEIKSNLNGDDKKIASVKMSKPVRFVVTPRIVIASIVAIIVLGGFFYIYRQIGRFAAVPRLVVTEPSDGENVEGNSIEIAGFTDKDAKLTINEQPIIVNDNGEFKENVLLQKGINMINISSTNRFEKSASKTFNINSNYQTPELANLENEGRVSGEEDARKNGVSVIVRADSLPTWISVEADGNLIYSGTMLPGAVQNFEGEKEVRVTSGKANQTYVRVNGKDEKKLADDPGIVRDILFTQND